MREFEIEIGAMVTVHLTDYFVVKAETREEAIEKAKEKFDQWLRGEYIRADYNEVMVGEILEGAEI